VAVLWSERLTAVNKQMEGILMELHRQLCVDHQLAIQDLRQKGQMSLLKSASFGSGAKSKSKPGTVRISHSMSRGASKERLDTEEEVPEKPPSLFSQRSTMQIGQNLIDVWPAWKEQRTDGTDLVRDMAREKTLHEKNAQTSPESSIPMFVRMQTVNFTTIPSGSWAIRPSSMQFLLWNLLFLIVLFYDCVSFPLSAFKIEHLFLTPNMVAAAFWTSDFVVSFFVGYDTSDGTCEVRLHKTAARYARTWMIPDLVVIVVDWVMLYLALVEADSGANPAGFARIGKSVRYMRIMRVMRLLRLRKIQEAMHQCDEIINLQYFSIIQKLIMNMVWILLLSHFIGCGWYAIGMEDFGQETWVSPELLDRPLEYRYLTALHWSITQFTPGSMNVQPVNSVERLYSVVVLVLGMVVFSSTVSSITAATNNLKDINAVYKHQIWTMRRYFREQKISAALTHRVLRYTEAIIKPKYQKVNVDQVKILPLLPQMLTKEIAREMYEKHLTVHPLFDALSDTNTSLMQMLCCIVKESMLEKGEMIFSPGQVCTSMYFVSHGTLEYFLWQEARAETLESKTSFCEAVLWTPWVHQGRMYARYESTIIALDAKQFHEVAQSFSADMEMLRIYADEFVHAMNDLAGNFTETEEDDQELSDLFYAQTAFDLLPARRDFSEGAAIPMPGYYLKRVMKQLVPVSPGTSPTCVDISQVPESQIEASKSTDSAIFEMSPLDDSLSEDFVDARA